MRVVSVYNLNVILQNVQRLNKQELKWNIQKPIVIAVGVSELTWCNIYFYYWNLQFLDIVIIDKTKVFLSQI